MVVQIFGIDSNLVGAQKKRKKNQAWVWVQNNHGQTTFGIKNNLVSTKKNEEKKIKFRLRFKMAIAELIGYLLAHFTF